MTQQHPITPPPELRRLWAQEAQRISPHDPVEWMQYVSEKAAQWGADRQLEADAEWLDQHSLDVSHLTIIPTGKGLVEAMRPKPPSLKERIKQAISSGDTELAIKLLENLDDTV